MLTTEFGGSRQYWNHFKVPCNRTYECGDTTFKVKSCGKGPDKNIPAEYSPPKRARISYSSPSTKVRISSSSVYDLYIFCAYIWIVEWFRRHIQLDVLILLHLHSCKCKVISYDYMTISNFIFSFRSSSCMFGFLIFMPIKGFVMECDRSITVLFTELRSPKKSLMKG